jgi:hypothetical protein
VVEINMLPTPLAQDEIGGKKVLKPLNHNCRSMINALDGLFA